ncbi:DinB family protein [Kitasatospora sp. MAP5-34]|uniref:DinB family protein n=1 Tax=Kitasatospora sp. MAP5-34 TaxID=3035102 RepID=UPI00247689FD|nr:DinB family protein [Kitasatospora sp. MAP5-34]MDH6580273.1 putative damage-inducible protein DinB [Kitasatospora sp. MAP5-34]
MTSSLPEPDQRLSDPSELLLDYLDYYRSVVNAKIEGMSDAELRVSRLPSGWTLLELLKHLVHMEQRWLRWGFRAEQVSAPWGDRGQADRWCVGPEETTAGLLAALHAGGEYTRAVVSGTPLSTVAAAGGRFPDDGTTRPTLGWILFHVLQEYARHAGHLDIVRELTDGVTGD